MQLDMNAVPMELRQTKLSEPKEMFIQLNTHFLEGNATSHALKVAVFKSVQYTLYTHIDISYRIVYKFYSRMINKKLQKLKCQHI
jgi:hypothetical protein